MRGRRASSARSTSRKSVHENHPRRGRGSPPDRGTRRVLRARPDRIERADVLTDVTPEEAAAKRSLIRRRQGILFSIVRYEMHFRASRMRDETKAVVGQASRQAVHVPQRFAPGSADAAVGASAARSGPRRGPTCEPRPGTIRSPFLPRKPRPGAAATRVEKAPVSTQTRKCVPRGASGRRSSTTALRCRRTTRW